jgi:hypothetical protein
MQKHSNIIALDQAQQEHHKKPMHVVTRSAQKNNQYFSLTIDKICYRDCTKNTSKAEKLERKNQAQGITTSLPRNQNSKFNEDDFYQKG